MEKISKHLTVRENYLTVRENYLTVKNKYLTVRIFSYGEIFCCCSEVLHGEAFRRKNAAENQNYRRKAC